jgi:Arc/MetJ-type ribon-helix-helix transcriptional regulator
LEGHNQKIHLGVAMNGTNKQESKPPNSSFYLPDKFMKMIDTLVRCGHYKNRSDAIRKLIENDFNAKISDPRDLLKQKLIENNLLLKELESMVSTKDEALEDLVTRYKERKNNMPAKALDSYERFSKNWITKNIDDANTALPGKSVDEIYEELEKIIKV